METSEQQHRPNHAEKRDLQLPRNVIQRRNCGHNRDGTGHAPLRSMLSPWVILCTLVKQQTHRMTTHHEATHVAMAVTLPPEIGPYCPKQQMRTAETTPFHITIPQLKQQMHRMTCPPTLYALANELLRPTNCPYNRHTLSAPSCTNLKLSTPWAKAKLLAKVPPYQSIGTYTWHIKRRQRRRKRTWR